jgi:transcriptional regulator with XRE-family HTH domain
MNTKTAEEIGKSISQMRKMRRVTQRELAEKLNTHQSMVARWEKGQIYCRPETVDQITQILDFSPDEIASTSTSRKGIEPELELLFEQVGTLNSKDRDVLQSILEAMLLRSRVRNVVETPSDRWRENLAG